MIRDIWTQGMDSIHDMRVVNADTVSYQSKTLDKCLKTAEREKKRKYLNAYLNECRYFTTFAALLDCLLGVEAESTLKHIDSRLAHKCQEPYSRTCGYTKIRVAITLVRSTHRYIRGGISVTLSQWEEVAGFHLFQ